MFQLRSKDQVPWYFVQTIRPPRLKILKQNLKSRHLRRLLEDVARDEPTQGDEDREIPPMGGGPRGMGVDHRPDQGHRHISVLLGAHPRQGHQGRIRGLTVAHRGDDFLLRGPNPKPHVEGHRRAEECASMNDITAVTPTRPVAHQENDSSDGGEANNHRDLLVLRAHRLHDGVVDEDAQEGDGQHDQGGRGPAAGRGIFEDLFLVIEHDHEEGQPGDPSPEGAPAEPKQGSRHQLRDDFFLGLAVHGRREGGVDEIEEIQKPDPEDPEEDVEPAKDRLGDVGDFRRVLVQKVHESLQVIEQFRSKARILVIGRGC